MVILTLTVSRTVSETVRLMG